MDLSDALGDWPSGNQNPNPSGGMFPGQQNSNSGWPGQPSCPAGWPGQPGQPSAPSGWPGQPGQPSAPSGWPGQPGQPSAPSGWPGQPGQPSAPSGWPGSSQPSNPTWPQGPPNPPNPTWPKGTPNPSQPTWPHCRPNPAQPSQINLNLPFNHKFSHGLQDKKLITVTGKVKSNANKITFDFHSNKDIVFHFNPRFNENGRQVIVRNSLFSTKWGREERELKRFPFTPGMDFEIKFLVTPSSFKVAVNNDHLLEYNHRSRNLRGITHFCVNNDVTLTNFKVEDLH